MPKTEPERSLIDCRFFFDPAASVTFGVRNGRSRRREKIISLVLLASANPLRHGPWIGVGGGGWVHLSQKLLHARDQVKKKRETRSDHHHQHHHEEEEDRGFFLQAPIHSFIPSTSLFVMIQSRRSDGLGKPALGRGRQRKCCKAKNKETRKSFMKNFCTCSKACMLSGMSTREKKGPFTQTMRTHYLFFFLYPFYPFSFSPSTPSPPVNSFPIERSNSQTRFGKAHTVALTG